MAGNVDSIHSLMFKGGMRSTHYAHYTFCSPAQYRFISFIFSLVGSEEDAKMPTLTGQ